LVRASTTGMIDRGGLDLQTFVRANESTVRERASMVRGPWICGAP
jgi:hypothetical protein